MKHPIPGLPLSETTIATLPEIDGFRGLREQDSNLSLRLLSGNSEILPLSIDEPTFLSCLTLVFDDTLVNRLSYFTESTYYYGFVFATRQPITPAGGVPHGADEVIADRYQFQVLPDNTVSMSLGTERGWFRVDAARWAHLEMTLWAMNEPTAFALIFTPTTDGQAANPRLQWLG